MSDSEHRGSQPPEDGGTDEVVVEQPTDQTLQDLMSRAHRPPRIDPQARARILANLKARRGRPPLGALRRLARKFRSSTGVGVALAAAAAIALVVSFVLQSSSPTTHRNDGFAPQRIVLADGSTVVLDRDSEIQVLAKRRVRLTRGRVLLDVQRADDPLVLETRHGRAVVLGTRFIMQDAGNQSHAAVARGTVRVESGEGSELLKPGDEGVLRTGEPPVRRPARRLTYLSDWAKPAWTDEQAAATGPIRNGALVAREPRWNREWPLEMRALSVDVHIEGGVARTTIDQTFFNHVDRQLEGRYSFPLPADAAISRLAMYVDGRLVEGGIVERQRGRDIYETIVYRRRDPALLEWMAGNLFRVRIFPLPARQEKRIILSYTQALPRLYDTEQLAVPIPAIDMPVGRVSFRAVVVDGADSQIASASHPMVVTPEGDDQVVTFESHNHVIGDDFLLTLRSDRGGDAAVTRYQQGSQTYLLARAQPGIKTAPHSYQPRRWVVLYDTSASRGSADQNAQATLLTHLLGELDEDDQLAVVAFDTTMRLQPGGMQRVGDLDAERVAAFVQAEGRDRVGGTDLAGAVKLALDRFAGEGAARPHLLYLGDGIAAGPDQSLQALHEAVAGRAVFVGVAIGEAVDETRLRGLADVTGGMFVATNRGDDLAWRAFDLIAALNTPRLLDLRATLIDDRGQPIDEAVAHAPRQVAGGEDVVVVAKLPAGRDAAQLTLAAKLDGEPWSQTLPLPSTDEDARYLPRLWARRQIEALVREGAGEHEKEITELGMDHFLVTPHTSLLVLENDAMYRQFRVNRGSSDGWARYAAPATVAVKVEPRKQVALATIPTGAILLRSPRPLFADPGIGQPNTGKLTGRGFGSGHGRLGRNRRAAEEDSLVDIGTIGFGVDNGVAMNEPRNAFDRNVVSTRSLAPADPAWVGLPMAAASGAPMPAASFAPQAGGPRLPNAQFGGGEGKSRRARPTRESPQFFGEDRPFGAPLSALAGMDKSVARLNAEVFRQGLETDGRYYGGYVGPGLRPVALMWPGDPRLDDLTELVPALLTDRIDGERELVLAEQAGGQRGTISQAARELLDLTARNSAAPRQYRTSERGTLTVAADGRFLLEQRSPTGLTERLVYDGTHLHTFYPELRLAVRRPVAPVEPAVLAAHAPFVVPSLAKLEAGYDVTRPGERTLRLRPLGGAAATAIELELNESLQVVSWRRGKTTLRFEREQRRLSIVATRGSRVVLEVASAAPPTLDTALPAGWIRVAVPARDPGHWEARIGDTSPGSAEWLDGQRQRLAALAALGKGEELWKVLEAIHQQRGAITRGELALASGGLRHAEPPVLERMVASLTEDDPVARHARATQRFAAKRSLAGFEAAAEALPEGLVGMLASYRLLLDAISDGDGKRALARYGRFAARGGYGPLRYVAAHQLSNRLAWEDPDAALAVWDDVARLKPFELLAGFQAAGVLDRADRHDAAVARLERLFEQADLAGTYPTITWNVRNTFTKSGGGEARWRQFLVKRRARLLEAGNPRALLAFLDTARAHGSSGDTTSVVAALGKTEVDDPGLARELAEHLRQLGARKQAWALLEPHFDGPQASEMLAFAADLAVAEDRHRDAAAYLARALDRATAGVPLAQLRASYQRQIELYLRASETMGADESLAAALAVAARWRRDDPDNAAIDQLCAATLYDRGNAEQAWRHLSSIIERHPAEGAAYAEVANTLEQRGELRQAQAIWQRATEVEPTNPRWLLRQAQGLIALGDSAEGKQLLRRIEEGSWQERFSDAVSTARRLLAPPSR